MLVPRATPKYSRYIGYFSTLEKALTVKSSNKSNHQTFIHWWVNNVGIHGFFNPSVIQVVCRVHSALFLRIAGQACLKMTWIVVVCSECESSASWLWIPSSNTQREYNIRDTCIGILRSVKGLRNAAWSWPLPPRGLPTYHLVKKVCPPPVSVGCFRAESTHPWAYYDVCFSVWLLPWYAEFSVPDLHQRRELAKIVGGETESDTTVLKTIVVVSNVNSEVVEVV